MIFADALPRIKTFLRPTHLAAATTALLVRLVAAFLCHRGRLSASQAASALPAQPLPATSLPREPIPLTQ